MSEYTFTDALNYSMAQLTEIDNASFREFYFPVVDMPLDVAHYCQHNNIDLGNTVIMWDGDTYVGISLLANRGRRGWIGAFGIVPEYRGRGAGKAMLAQQLAVARSAGLQQVWLEVLAQNARAQRLYEGAGFKLGRALLVLKTATAALPPPPTTLSISSTKPEQIIDWVLQGQRPAWARERARLLVTETDALVVNGPNGPDAAMLYRRHGIELEIGAVALIDDHNSASDFLAMLHHAAAGTEKISIQDEPDDTLLYRVCKESGFEEENRQYEMVVEL
jgi:GNAT superfamily N-acetyltransferase